MLLLDKVNLLQRIDPNRLSVDATGGIIVQDMRHGRRALRDDLLEKRIVDQVRGGLEALDGSTEDLVAVQREGLDVGGEGLDLGGGGLDDGCFLGRGVGAGDLVGALVEFEPYRVLAVMETCLCVGIKKKEEKEGNQKTGQNSQGMSAYVFLSCVSLAAKSGWIAVPSWMRLLYAELLVNLSSLFSPKCQ